MYSSLYTYNLYITLVSWTCLSPGKCNARTTTSTQFILQYICKLIHAQFLCIYAWPLPLEVQGGVLFRREDTYNFSFPISHIAVTLLLHSLT